jgi:hypothetical protein
MAKSQRPVVMDKLSSSDTTFLGEGATLQHVEVIKRKKHEKRRKNKNYVNMFITQSFAKLFAKVMGANRMTLQLP